MFLFEWLVVLYMLLLGAAAAVRSMPGGRRVALLLCGGTVLVVLIVSLLPVPVRLVAPNLYLIAGYWVPALLIPADVDCLGPTNFERWLIRTDEVLRPRLPGVPASVAVLTETAYLACYPVVPLSMIVVWIDGGDAGVARFWTTLLFAGFASYASLPWLLSRPPKPIPGSAAGLRRLNAYVLSRASHRWTTFPSGHVAVSWAAAFAVLRVSPGAAQGGRPRD
jgi:hypothetical protein